MWTQHWKLDFAPFSARSATFVPLPSRVEGLARLTHAIEAGEPAIALVAESGQGKSILVREALARVRHPLRRLVRIDNPANFDEVLDRVVRGLGRRVTEGGSAWREFLTALDLASLQNQQVVVVVDETNGFSCERLGSLSGHYPLTVVSVSRDEESGGFLTIAMPGLTRAEALNYLEARWQRAGGQSLPIEPRGLTTLHAIANGVPGRLNSLATRAFIVAANRGAVIVTEADVERIAEESLTPGWSVPRGIG